MPASVFSQMNTNSQLVEDQRALQLAFELSLLGINGEDDNGPSSNNGNLSPQSFVDEANKKSANMTECVPVPSSEHVAEIVGRQGMVFYLHSHFALNVTWCVLHEVFGAVTLQTTLRA